MAPDSTSDEHDTIEVLSIFMVRFRSIIPMAPPTSGDAHWKNTQLITLMQLSVTPAKTIRFSVHLPEYSSHLAANNAEISKANIAVPTL